MTEWVVRLNGLEQNFDVDITRRGKWGNPFIIGIHGNRSIVIELHRRWINGRVPGPDGQIPPTKADIVRELKGKRLGCVCAPKRCHGDYLALVANAPQQKGLFSRLVK